MGKYSKNKHGYLKEACSGRGVGVLEVIGAKGESRAHRRLSKYLSRMISMGQLIAETARRSGLLGL